MKLKPNVMMDLNKIWIVPPCTPIAKFVTRFNA